MPIKLYEHQKIAINQMKNGSILRGGVGSGKSRTALAYYFLKECGGKLKINGEGGYSPMKQPKDLYIITTARKRDTLEWEQECVPFLLSTNKEVSMNGTKVVVDSWNNISKYVDVKNAFFIFDEQRLVGSGTWVKSFLKITKSNSWVLLSATPGDNWMDYVPVFIANGFYKNRTEFLRKHVVFNSYTKYPKVERYIDVGILVKHKKDILVEMKFNKPTIAHNQNIITRFDKESMDKLLIKRWNIFEDRPIKDVNELCLSMRRLVNSDPSRVEAVINLMNHHDKIIIFYNFNYELDILKRIGEHTNTPTAEWNGHKHELIPKTDKWIYLVQYTAGAEGWNCIETNCTIFYSQNYSYKIMIQAAGRIDRLNTPFTDLYYYHLISNSVIDLAISKSLKNKKNFNENKFMDV